MNVLENQLTLKQKELDLILAIDQIRDGTQGPTVMLSGIVNIIAEVFAVDLCLLYLINQETHALELKVMRERNHGWQQLNVAILETIAQRALQLPSIEIWNGRDVLPKDVAEKMPNTLQFAIMPIFMETQNLPLGILVLTRTSQPFSENEEQLLTIAECQIDSAVIQAYTHHELTQRNKELETIYRFDRIRDQQLPFDEMLNVVLNELCAVIKAEMGFVMLYNQEGERLEMRALTNEDLLRDSDYYRLVNELANEAMTTAKLQCMTNKEYNKCAIMCVPLILREEIIGVFGAVNRDPNHTFTTDDRRLLHAIVSQMDTAILESMEQRQLRRVLGRSLDPNVLERLLATPNVDILEGERAVLSILYADLRGSTNLAEHTTPEALVAFVNAYLGAMTEVLLSYHGTLDKFVGDEVMALFNAPLPQPDHALRAVRVGLAMQEQYQALQQKWLDEHGMTAGGIGVGIATGEAIVGEIGCEKRTDYTVIGRPANLGSRICSAAKAGEVLISEETYQMIKTQIEATAIPDMHFKGIDHAVTVYRVEKILES